MDDIVIFYNGWSVVEQEIWIKKARSMSGFEQVAFVIDGLKLKRDRFFRYSGGYVTKACKFDKL